MSKDGSRIREILLRARWSAEDARMIFSAWEESKLPATEFAGKHGFDVQRLYWWRRRLGKLDTVSDQRGGFEEIVVADREPGDRTDAGIEITLPGGLAIRIPATFDEPTLRRVLKVVREDCAC